MSHPSLSGSLFQGLLTDFEVTRLLSEDRQIAHMLKVEAELALAQGDVGLIPADAAQAISNAIGTLHLTPQDLQAGTAKDGIPVPALVHHIKARLSEKQAPWAHYGATSQDIMDTALILTCREVLDLIEARLRLTVHHLASLTEQHQGQLVAGRTRSQQGAPMNLGLKISGWLRPLVRQLERLGDLRKRLYKVQLAGAVGNLSALSQQADATAARLAERLDLAYEGGWHTQRDSITELGGWLAMTNGALGKMAYDLMLMAQTEVGEVRFADGGGSSTLPQKSNPVKAELIQTLASQSASLAGQLYQSAVSAHERDGAAWTGEWLTLPVLLSHTGTALAHSLSALDNLIIDANALERNLWQSRGLLFAETLTFQLGQAQSRDAAKKLVTQEVHAILADPAGTETLIDRVNAAAGTEYSATGLANELLHAGSTDQDIARALTRARDWPPAP